MALLCDYGNKEAREVIKEILYKLYNISKDFNEFKKYLLMIEELSVGYDIKNMINTANILSPSR